MRLKTIKLAGFKSFVDPTSIDFPSNLCAVVGPNGCGKSNVIDAVRWVMGESSARNLRGEHMTDVIFNGSDGRKPVGQASIELVFDNHDHALSGEYAKFDEVSVRRKVDRDAVSSYSINGTKCRRRDVTDLFLGTGLGARSYSIIEQGMVSRLIESKPEELRVFIEEAAGISRYKERRRETENRVRRTRENLARLGDIREELNRQLSGLRRQTVAAKKYRQIKSEEQDLRLTLNALRWRRFDGELKRLAADKGRLANDIEAGTARQRELDADIEAKLARHHEVSRAHESVQKRFYELGGDITRKEQDIAHHVERVGQFQLDLSETRDGLRETEGEQVADREAIAALEAEIGQLEPQLATARQHGQAAAKDVEVAEATLAQRQREWDAFSESAEEPRQEAKVEQSLIQQLETAIGKGLARREKLQAELANLEKALAADDGRAADSELAQLDYELREGGARLEELGDSVRRQRQELAELSATRDERSRRLLADQGRLKALEILQRAALGQDDETLNAWLADRRWDSGQRLGNALHIAAGWERAVEVALGGRLASLCVDALPEDLPEQEPPPAAVCLMARGGPEMPPAAVAGLGSLASQVRCDWNVQRWLRGIACAESWQQARALRDGLASDESIILKDGTWLGRDWLLLPGVNAEDSAAKRAEDIAALREAVAGQVAQLEQLDARSQERNRQLEEGERTRDARQADLAEKSRALGELKSAASARQARAQEGRARRARIHEELRDLEQAMTAEQQDVTAARARLQRALDSMGRDENDRDRVQNLRDESQAHLKAARLAATRAQEVVNDLAMKLHAAQSRLESTRAAMERVAAQVQRSKKRMAALQSQIEDADAPLGAMKEELDALLGKRLQVEGDLTKAKAKVDENERAMRQLERQRDEAREKVAGLREQVSEIRVAGEGVRVQRAEVEQHVAKAGRELREVVDSLPDDGDEDACERELERLGAAVVRLGNVNLTAIDELEQQEERKRHLDRQNEELEKALGTLQAAIRKIDKETRTRFRETFDKINAGLQTLFPRLFGGGQACLDLTGDDLLDTGVIVRARPPGKRNSTIALLSGGEKSMTAIALVFAIFNLNPAPFCMLDEVDAPLDDANVGRYADLIKEMADQVQFIVVTHNKITMEMAHQLLGVTMQEAGVSRLVTVDLDEAARMVAAGGQA